MSGNFGWLIMLIYIVAWDILAPVTLSDAFYNAFCHPLHKWWVIVVWAVITLHLFRIVPKRYDLIHIITDFVKDLL